MKIIQHPRVLTLFIVLSFLTIFFSGEKNSMFMFMYITFLPLLVIDGSGNIFSLTLSKEIIYIIDIIYVAGIFFSIFFLLLSYFRKIQNNNILHLICIAVLSIPVWQALSNPIESTFSIATIIMFLLISITSAALTIWQILFKASEEKEKNGAI